MTFTGYTGPDLNYVLKDWTVKPRNPNRHKEYEENSIGKMWGSGSKKYVLEFTNK